MFVFSAQICITRENVVKKNFPPNRKGKLCRVELAHPNTHCPTTAYTQILAYQKRGLLKFAL